MPRQTKRRGGDRLVVGQGKGRAERGLSRRNTIVTVRDYLSPTLPLYEADVNAFFKLNLRIGQNLTGYPHASRADTISLLTQITRLKPAILECPPWDDPSIFHIPLSKSGTQMKSQ